jgi:small-conductance mechanosensitive channel
MQPNVEVLEFFKPSGLPIAFLIVAVTFIIVRLLNNGLSRLGARFPDRRLLVQQVGSFIRFALYFLGGLGALATVVVLSREVMLAVGGTTAVAIGFALRDIAASMIAGLVILIDKPFQVGDRVSFEDHYGEVQSIGLRSVRLMTLDDTLITIPNSKFLTDAVASANAGHVEMMVQMDYFVAVDQDVSRAKRIVQEALTTSRYVHLQRSWAVLVSEVVHQNYFAVRLRAKAYVLDVRFEKQFETDVTERVLSGFRDADIQPPAVLHRDVGGGFWKGPDSSEEA